jgi:hypothetical protein
VWSLRFFGPSVNFQRGCSPWYQIYLPISFLIQVCELFTSFYNTWLKHRGKKIERKIHSITKSIRFDSPADFFQPLVSSLISCCPVIWSSILVPFNFCPQFLRILDSDLHTELCLMPIFDAFRLSGI